VGNYVILFKEENAQGAELHILATVTAGRQTKATAESAHFLQRRCDCVTVIAVKAVLGRGKKPEGAEPVIEVHHHLHQQTSE
jgi:hypothetical protein